MADDVPVTGSRTARIAAAVAVAVVLVAAIAWSATALLRPDAVHLTLTTGGDGGTYLPIGRALAEVVNKRHPEIILDIVESSGAVENMQRIETGATDLAMVQNDTLGPASVRTVAPLYREVLHFLVRRDAGIDSFRKIRGKRVAVGGKGSGTEALVSALLGHFDLEYADFEPRYVGANAAVDQLIAGDVDAMLFVGGMKSAACERAIGSGLVQFVGLGSPGVDAGEIEGFRFDYPFVEPYVIPLRTYASPSGGQPERPIATVAIRAVLVVHDAVPAETIYKITEAMFSGRTELIRSHSSAVELRERFDETWLQYPVHAGAQKYFRRDEPGFLVTYAELMGFLLSVLVAIAALFATAREWVRLRKKNRIDVYYTRLDQILDELKTDDPSVARLDELDTELSELRRTAFRQLVAEQLRADESFRIFQDFLAECQRQIDELRGPTTRAG